MKNFILTVLIISILFSVGYSLADTKNWVYSFAMYFSFLLLQVFLATCVFCLIRTILKRIRNETSLILEMSITFIVILTFIYLIHLPDYLRHQNEAGYVPYKSLTEYFNKELAEATLMTIAFSITIPITNRILERKKG